jgi:hypothetical protein
VLSLGIACRAPSGDGNRGDLAAFTGSASCGSCHAAQLAAWRTSQHAVAMEAATTATVLGDFSDASHTEDGVTSRFFMRDGRYVVNTAGADGQLHDYEVVFTFGVAPLQQYLVPPRASPASPRLGHSPRNAGRAALVRPRRRRTPPRR